MPYGHNLALLVESTDRLKHIDKERVRSGDWLFVRTRNSLYTLRAVGDGWFEISGGWFDRKGGTGTKTRINGCTWGGKAINLNIAAACGLCIEFSNRVVTSPVQKIILLDSSSLN